MMRQVQVSVHGVKENAAFSLPCSSRSSAVCTLVTWSRFSEMMRAAFLPMDLNIHGFMFASLTGASWALRLGTLQKTLRMRYHKLDDGAALEDPKV